jgi:hypothetical protein
MWLPRVRFGPGPGRIDADRSGHADLAGDRGAGTLDVGVVAGEAAELVAGELSRLSVQTPRCSDTANRE